MPELSEQQVRQLFSIATSSGVAAFLDGLGAMSGNGWKWVPLGGRENNAGSVNLAVESGQALVERNHERHRRAHRAPIRTWR